MDHPQTWTTIVFQENGLVSNWTDSGTLLANKTQHGIVVLVLLQIYPFHRGKETVNPLPVSQ